MVDAHCDRIRRLQALAKKLAFAPPGGAPAPGGMPMDPSMMGGGQIDPAMIQAAMDMANQIAAQQGGAPGGMPMDPSMMGGAPAPGGMPMDPSMMGGASGGDPLAALSEKIDAIGYMLTRMVEYLNVPLDEGGAPPDQGQEQGVPEELPPEETAVGQEEATDEMVPPDAQDDVAAASADAEEQAAVLSPAAEAATGGAPQEGQNSFIRQQLGKFQSQ